jgi:enoyl-CoA hydratase/carnithine racemase
MTQFRAFSSADDALAYEARMDRVFDAVERCPLPTVAAIAGACTGGGAALAAACDIRIATVDLRFGVPIARTLGNCLSVANLARLSALVGAGRVTDLLFTARLLGAEEALAAGLISEVVADHDALITRATELADVLAGHAPLTLAATKEGLRRLRIQGADADDRDIVVRTYMSADFKEGLEAFLAKRKPNWTGA